jgi:predicted acetylornithine/succinylornithine family transaminase
MTNHRQEALLELAGRVLLASYRRQPIVMQRGQGVHLWDVAGTRYLDMTAGIAVCCLGHAHPALTRAIASQAEQLLHVSNLYHIDQQILAAQAILAHCSGDRVFFCNSGAEANEAAIKLVRRYQHVVAGKPERTTIVSTLGSFHGRSIGTVSVTGQEKYRAGFGPMFGPVEFVPFGDLEAAARALERKDACAFIVEPVQADGGVVPAPPGYLIGLRKIADATQTLLIIDEVQTGFGRTGTWFAYQHDNAVPDVMTLAKAVGGGVAAGVLVATEKISAGLMIAEGGPAPHASTFGGNPLACAAIQAVIQCLEDERLIEHGAELGAYLGQRLEELAARYPGRCKEARGRGLLRGIAMIDPAAAFVTRCREKGVLLSAVGGNVVRFTPALIVRREHIDEALLVVDEVLREPS